MNDIAIYGAGGLGREIACLIEKVNQVEKKWNLVGFFDDALDKSHIIPYGEILGGMEDLNRWHTPLSLLIAIGNGFTVKFIYEKISNKNIVFPNLEYDLWTADRKSFEMGIGNIICGGCSFSCDVKIGNFNIFNGGVNLGHDVKMGNYNVLMPSTRISGDVKIGDTNFFGVNSIVLQGINIGSEIRLGAGSVLMTKPKDGELYIGNPARRFRF